MNSAVILVVRFDNADKADEDRWRFREYLGELRLVDDWPPQKRDLDEGVCELTFRFMNISRSDFDALPEDLVVMAMEIARQCKGGVQSITLGT